MFTRFANVEVLDIYGSNHRVKTASLAKASEFDAFQTENGYLYARLRAISSRVNKNHDAWPSVEIAGDHELIHKLGKVATREASLGKEVSGFRVSAAKNDRQHFIVEAKKGSRYGFSTFLGKPIFVDHNNSNHRRSRGVIVDSRLHVEPYTDDPYYKTADCHESFKPATWVELLLEIDANTFPKFAKAIVDGAKDPATGIDGFSMGANVERSTCSHCANVATNPDEFCQHIKGKGAYWDYIDPKTGSKTSKRSFEFCGGVQYFEISGVFDPADETALSMGIVASLQKEGEERLEDGPADMYYQWKQPTGQIFCPTCSNGDDPNCSTCHGKGAVFTPYGIHGDDGVRGVTNISPDDVTHQIDPSILGPVHQGALGDVFPDNYAEQQGVSTCKNCGKPLDVKAQMAGKDLCMNCLTGRTASVKTSEGVDDINMELYRAPTAVQGSPDRPAPWTEDPAKREQIIQRAISKARKVEGGMAQLHAFLKQAGIDPVTAEFYNQYGEEDIDPLRGPEGKYLNGPLINPALNRFPGTSQMPPGDLAKDEGFEQIPYQVDPYADPRTYRNDAEGLSVRPTLDNSGDVRNNEVDVNGLPVGTPAPNRPGGIYDQEAPMMNDPRWSSLHKADNTPQVDLLRAPKPIDTLSSPITCPVCGEEMQGEQCDVCGEERPPEGFGDPDLQKAHENVEQRLENESPPDDKPAVIQQDSELLDKNLPPQDFPTKHYVPTSHVNIVMPRWRIVEAGVINNNDKLIKPGNKPATNEPVEKVLSDQLAPVTSKVHTAADFLAAAGHLTNTGDIMERTADATAQAPEVAKPKTQVDVVGVGGVDEATNEEASKPSVGEVDVLDIGGVDSDVAADEHETLPDSSGDGDAGFNTDKTTDGSGPTRTWNDGYGDSLGQHDPITREPFPAHAEGVTSAQRTAYDNEPFPKDDGGLAGGGAQRGNEPIDPSFKADERVDLFQTVTSPENNSGPTKTWSGTDGNGVNKQQDPVTKDQYPPNDGFGKGSSQHLFAAFKLADEEVKVGLITEDEKFARVAELENDPHEVTAGLKYVARLKAAGLGKREAAVKRLPSLQGQRTASTTVESALDPAIDGQDDWVAFL